MVVYGIALSFVFSTMLLVGRTSYSDFVLLGSVIAGLAVIILAAFTLCLSIKCPDCDLPYFAKGTMPQRLLSGRFYFRRKPCCHCGSDVFQQQAEE
jgi:hypothetical protein